MQQGGRGASEALHIIAGMSRPLCVGIEGHGRRQCLYPGLKTPLNCSSAVYCGWWTPGHRTCKIFTQKQPLRAGVVRMGVQRHESVGSIVLAMHPCCKAHAAQEKGGPCCTVCSSRPTMSQREHPDTAKAQTKHPTTYEPLHRTQLRVGSCPWKPFLGAVLSRKILRCD